MTYLLLLLLTNASFAQAPLHWAGATEISDKHEFYQEGKTLEAPKDSWQSLFAVNYITKDLVRLKDCVFYRIPGTAPGELKLITLDPENKCEDKLLLPGEREITDVKSLEFKSVPGGMNLTFALPKYKLEQWEIRIPTTSSRQEPRMLLSSAAYKAPKVILLAAKESAKMQKTASLKEGICHDISEACEEISPSRCSECAEGWFEIPNGCLSGPKFCGRDRCGEKNQPACRRGMKYQKKDVKYECRIDSSFAYCRRGLVIQCEGALAFCR